MKKGFTLIELLAVIIILAIIALIAVPIVLNIINSSKMSAEKNSKELYIDAVQQAIARKNLTDEFNPTTCKINQSGNLDCDGVTLIVETEGKRPCQGNITFKKGKVESETMTFTCIYADDSGANAPDLLDGVLTSVTYNGSNWVVVDPEKNKWYDYDKQEWANAVMLNEGVEKEEEATLNLETDVKAMFVWIPRYEYTIKSPYGDGGSSASSPGAIDIRFVSEKEEKEKGNATYTDQSDKESSWYTHPAFTFGSEELSGIWIGKFETTGTKDNPTILPSQLSLVGQPATEQTITAQKFNENLNGLGDFHMAKNSEWGAAAYLSQSKYGKYGKDGKEVYANSCNKFITGIAGSTASAANDSTCANTYETEAGWKASTTGTIYGVYDMSGGAWEYVMGRYSSKPNSENGTVNKYLDEYTGSIDEACSKNACNGHALNETKGWYGDYSHFVSSSYSWLLRGGFESNGSIAGVFAFGDYTGGGSYNHSFRIILSPTS